MYQDRDLVCADCGAPFVFTASEQEFHASKGFTNDPKRCPNCRAARKQNGPGRSPGGFGERQMYDATCAACGKATQVPFQPRGDRPVYCRDCFQPTERRGGGGGGNRW